MTQVRAVKEETQVTLILSRGLRIFDAGKGSYGTEIIISEQMKPVYIRKV
jgi:hypothetical protein